MAGVCWAEKGCVCVHVCVYWEVGIIGSEDTRLVGFSLLHNLFYLFSFFLSPPYLPHSSVFPLHSFVSDYDLNKLWCSVLFNTCLTPIFLYRNDSTDKLGNL